MKRAVFRVFAAAMLLLCLFPLLHTPAEAVCSMTLEEAMSWLAGVKGDTIEDGQCVRLIQAYYTQLGVARPAGNARDYKDNTLPSGWERYKGATPKKGDIMVWTNGWKGYGHVAICAGSGKYYHQNWDGEYVSVETNSYTDGFSVTDKNTGTKYRGTYWGVIRPDYPEESLGVKVPEAAEASVADGTYMLKSAANTAYYMNVYAGKDANGTKVVTWTVDKETKDQHFRFERQEDGSYCIFGAGLTDRLLDISNGRNNNHNNGDELQVWKAGVDLYSTFFNVVPAGGNKFVLELTTMEDSVLGITRAANNAPITLQKYTGHTRQQWYICDRSGKTLSACDLGAHQVTDGACAVCGKVFVAITTQPRSVWVPEGEKAAVTLEAEGDGLTYKWYYKNPGESKYTYTSTFKGNSYSVVMNDARDGRYVYCKITDKYGNTVKSKTVSLNMQTPLEILTQPTSVRVASGKTARVTVTAQGDGLTYEWYYKNPGATKYTRTDAFTGNSYSITMNASRDGRYVFCRVYDKYGNMVQTKTVSQRMK